MDNADLEKLKVSQGKLVPKFKASITSYSVTVGSNVQEIKLSPLTADGGASYVVKVRGVTACSPSVERSVALLESLHLLRAQTATRWLN